MATFSLTAINVGTFNLGEADKIITLFSREKGIHRAVAKGARKPGAKIAGKAELLNVNKLLLAKGKNLDIITQCESIETYPNLRHDLRRLTYAFYYAELTQVFGQGLTEECARYFDRLILSIGLMAASGRDPALLCLEFEFALLEMLGIRPELNYCVSCRDALNERNISAFNHELGGLLCQKCFYKIRAMASNSLLSEVHEEVGIALEQRSEAIENQRTNIYVTPLVWKRMVLACIGSDSINIDGLDVNERQHEQAGEAREAQLKMATSAARRVMQSYIEYKSGRRMRALDLLSDLV
ncbi:DNA repair protein RecO [bacterium]|nr:DNA repair protein RecO [bacterium]MBP9093093.1 DNA repair protein RecO [bacterium]MBP9811023.1 DNA repair protein RecO [bacterium]